MARHKHKLCPGCQLVFRGRPNAVTCSDRCRKRLQRARLPRSVATATGRREQKSGAAA